MVAVHRQAPYQKRVEQFDCDACKGNEFLRQTWGCDEPTADPLFEIPCKGGREGIHQCPSKLVGDDGEAWEAVWLHGAWPENRPYSGGIYDQPAKYVEQMRILDIMKSLIDKEQGDG